MSPDLDKKLVEKYPEIFRDRHGKITETCMGWGFSCEGGWYDLINTLCANIQSHIDNTKSQAEARPDLWKPVPQVVAMQVKEKFGTLRFYVSGGDEKTDGMIRMAESMSARICEVCGDKGKTRRSWWVRTLCDKHNLEQNGTDLDDDDDADGVRDE